MSNTLLCLQAFATHLIWWAKDSSANLHANFHVGEVSVGHFSGHQLPQQDSKAPHVCWPTVDIFRLLLQGWKSQRATSLDYANTLNYTTGTASLYKLHNLCKFSHKMCKKIRLKCRYSTLMWFITSGWTGTATTGFCTWGAVLTLFEHRLHSIMQLSSVSSQIFIHWFMTTFICRT